MKEKTQIDEKIFEFIFDMSFRDATLRSALIKKSNEDEETFQNRKEEIKEATKKHVEDYINDIMNGKLRKETDEGEKGLTVCYIQKVLSAVNGCKKCKNVYKKNGKTDNRVVFTFGNAQKLVNMAAKYLFVVCYKNEGLIDNFAGCHCPMDSYMIKGVWDNSGLKGKVPPETIQLRRNTTWSTLTESDEDVAAYNDFQDYVRKLCGEQCILEYDYQNWSKFVKAYPQ